MSMGFLNIRVNIEVRGSRGRSTIVYSVCVLVGIFLRTGGFHVTEVILRKTLIRRLSDAYQTSYQTSYQTYENLRKTPIRRKFIKDKVSFLLF